jgi:hypothetical protein
MKLKEILDKVDDFDVLNKFQELYDEKEGNLVGYSFLLNDLREIEPEESEYTLHIKYVDKDFDDTPMDEPYYDISGQIEEDGRYAMEFVPWAKWLGSEVNMDDLAELSMSLEDFIIHCMWEMTFMGFDEGTIKDQIDELNKRVEDIESGKVECIPWEDVKKKLEDKLDTTLDNLDKRLSVNEDQIKVTQELIDNLDDSFKD